MTTTTTQPAFYSSADEARTAARPGWNLRCNRCGTYGATWTEQTERPGWGSLALCPPHRRELDDEHARHRAALAILRAVNYEQDTRTLPYRPNFD